MNTPEYLKKFKEAKNLPSDYALAAHLGVTRSYISSLQNGRNHLSDDLCYVFADALNIHVGIILIDMHRQKAHTAREQSAWNEIAKGFLSLLLPAKRTLV